MAKLYKPVLMLTFLLQVVGVQSAQAQWLPTGVPICISEGEQLRARIVSDGLGGAIITWEGGNPPGNVGISGGFDVYAQRINANGVVRWAENGIPVCTAINGQGRPQIVSDGEGGAVIAWQDGRSGTRWDLYAQRIDSDGYSEWAEGGVFLGIGDEWGWDLDLQIAADGFRGAIIAYRAYHPDSAIVAGVYVQRVTANGSAVWGANGISIGIALGDRVWPRIVEDGQHGAIITWMEGRPRGGWRVYVQRINPEGIALWGPNGIAVCSASSEQGLPEIASDGSGGAIVVWRDDERGCKVYTQKIGGDGELLWPDDGIAVSGIHSDCCPQIVSDEAGGAIVTWSDFIRIYAQRVDSMGLVRWGTNGVTLRDYAYVGYPHLIKDGFGGAIIMWEDGWGGNDQNIYAQRVNAAGATLWAENGIPVCRTNAYQDGAQAILDGAGGAIAVWRDARECCVADISDIYAQKIHAAGEQPIATLLISYSAVFSESGISLSWTLSEANEGVRFFVLRSTAAEETYIELPSSFLTSDDLSFSFMDTDWKPNTSHWYRVEYSTGSERKTLFESGPVTTPAMPLTLYQNSPNPFNPSTEIRYYLPEKCSVSLDVYDVTGVLVARLSEGYRDKGTHTVSWDGRDRNGRQMSSGVYFYRLKAGKTEISRKMVLAR